MYSRRRATDLRSLILDLKQQGILSLSGIARGLNARGIPTARSGQLWTATQVAGGGKVELRAHFVPASCGLFDTLRWGDVPHTPPGDFFQISDFNTAE